MNGFAKEVKKSYVHGSTTVPMLYDTIGERLRLAAKKVGKGRTKINSPLVPRPRGSDLQEGGRSQNLQGASEGRKGFRAHTFPF